MLESFIQWLLDRFRDLGYPGIVILMAIESSFLPLPSELVMPPAGYLAAKGELNFVLAIVCGVAGTNTGPVAQLGAPPLVVGAGGWRSGARSRSWARRASSRTGACRAWGTAGSYGGRQSGWDCGDWSATSRTARLKCLLKGSRTRSTGWSGL